MSLSATVRRNTPSVSSPPNSTKRFKRNGSTKGSWNEVNRRHTLPHSSPLSPRSASFDSPSTNPVDQNAREARIDTARGLGQRGGVRGSGQSVPLHTSRAHAAEGASRPVSSRLAITTPPLSLPPPSSPSCPPSHSLPLPSHRATQSSRSQSPLFHQLRRPLVWPLLANLRGSSLRSKEQRHTHLRKHNTRHHSRQLLCTPCSFRSSCLHSTLQIRQNTTLERCGGKEGVGHPRIQTPATHPLLVGHRLPHFLLLPLLPRACFSHSTPTRTALKLVGLLHNHRIQLISDRIGSALAGEEDALSGYPPLLHLSLHVSLPSYHHPEKVWKDVRGFVCAAMVGLFEETLIEFVVLESHLV
ncbi:hypothetical protein BLNAU_21853 [Blattamonas nauphoetae]|uniref:Uncharacterized protein n=1 Tax=Blattamonas nauphoetae TaxID=2049346 RepID=A0ABQ9WX15_9EUKA|nr:hypothetical protein BLNAU_21853 [Blattamonas nauphoetae]